jgi:transcriptional regulator with AAA-type ATPase domain
VITPEPTTVSSALRGIVAIMMLGAPTTLAAGLIARGAPEHRGAIVLAACSVSILVGLIARAVARPLGPEQSRWLDAIEAASRGALQPEPDAAIRAALEALSRAAPRPGTKPELWRADPPEVLSVDIAGYLHVGKGEAPERVYELGMAEPERTLRAEVLESLEVRRPEVRPLIAWFENRHAFSATLILDEDGPSGFILMPRGNRSAPMTLEEARAVRLLADRISALFAVSSALARSRHRELAAEQRADTMDGERQRLEQIIAVESGRNRARAEPLAERVVSTCYGPAARFALSEVERLGKLGHPIALQVAPGTDATGWAAVAHLHSPRASGPFVVVHGADPAERDLKRWEDPERSPLRLADGGTLLVADVAALPAEVGEHLARSLSRAAQIPIQSSVAAGGLIVSVNAPLEELAQSERLPRSLLRVLSDGAVSVPGLADRPEDLHALLVAGVARAGLLVRGEPLGIDPVALRVLLEHTWPGNEAELEAVLLRAAQIAGGPRIDASDLDAIGFRSEPSVAELTPVHSLAGRLRRRPRR